MQMSQIAKRIVFTGQVQGVGFRFTAFNIANRIGLKGYVRNLPDGSVEMIAQGRDHDITGCIDDIKQTYQGSLTEVKTQPLSFNPKYNNFKITF